MLCIEEIVLMARLQSPTLIERQLRKATHQNMNILYSKFKDIGSVDDQQSSDRPSLEEDKVKNLLRLILLCQLEKLQQSSICLLHQFNECFIINLE